MQIVQFTTSTTTVANRAISLKIPRMGVVSVTAIFRQSTREARLRNAAASLDSLLAFIQSSQLFSDR